MTNNVKKQKSSTGKFSLARTFNKFAKKAVQDFPHLKDKFIIYSAPTDSWHGKAIDNPLLETLSETLKEEAQENPFDSAAFADRAHGYHFIAYMNKPELHFMTKASAPHEKELLAVLEHELGHLIAPQGFRYVNDHGYNFRECVADSFAMIRSKQQHKSIAGSLETMTLNKSIGMVFYGHHDNFTVPVLQELNRLSKIHNLSELTPIQSANLAYRLSAQYAYSEKQLRQLKRIFAPVRKAYDETDLKAALKECAKIMFADHGEYSQMVFTSCKSIIEPFLNRDKNALNPFLPLADVRLEGKFWNNIRDRIKEYEDSLPKETPEQRLARKAGYLQALGRFDRQPDKVIGPKKYESAENQARLQSARQDYMAKAAAKRGLRPPC